MKSLIRKLIKNIFGEAPILFYHGVIARMAAAYYGKPSEKMLVIAITGTKGKTTTLNYMHSVLTAGGYKVGLLSTANIKIGEKEILNWYHMTMPGKFLFQKMLRQILDGGCEIVLTEVTSEGIKQNRHIALNYDVAIFSNIFPEHLPSHGGSFEKYRNTKGILFSNIKNLKTKKFRGENFAKTIIINSDEPETEYFAQFKAERNFTFGALAGDVKAENIKEENGEVSFEVKGEKYIIPSLGVFNVYNVLPSLVMANILKISPEQINKGLTNTKVIPGRMEKIDEGQDFTVYVDYAHEGVSMRKLLEAVQPLRKDGAKIYVLYGAEGGGRDKKKRDTMSKAVADLADVPIITTVDPYEEDAVGINDDIERYLKMYSKTGVYQKIHDRREAIRWALTEAKTGDVVLVACKGAEQSMIINGKSVPWDDRTVVREELRLLGK